MFSGDLDPGNIVIVREILDGNGAGTDRALFSDIRAGYECTDVSGATPQPLTRCPREWDGRRLRVGHLAATCGRRGYWPVTGPTPSRTSRSWSSPTASRPTRRPVDAVAGNNNARVSFVPSVSVVTGYEVQDLDASAGRCAAPIAEPDITSLLVTGLTNGQTYTFRVRGLNEFGTGEWSLPSNAVTPHAEGPGPSGPPEACSRQPTGELSWTAPATTAVRRSRGTRSGSPTSTGSRSGP